MRNIQLSGRSISAKSSAEAAVVRQGAYKAPAPVQNGTHVSSAAAGKVPAPFVFSYANSSGAATVLRLGDPTGFLSQAYAATVAASTISFGYTDTSLNRWLQYRTLSFNQIDYQVTTSTTQFNNPFNWRSGYAQDPSSLDLSSYVVQAKNPNALDPELLKIRFDRSFTFGTEGALFLTVNNGETVNLTIYWDAIY